MFFLILENRAPTQGNINTTINELGRDFLFFKWAGPHLNEESTLHFSPISYFIVCQYHSYSWNPLNGTFHMHAPIIFLKLHNLSSLILHVRYFSRSFWYLLIFKWFSVSFLFRVTDCIVLISFLSTHKLLFIFHSQIWMYLIIHSFLAFYSAVGTCKYVKWLVNCFRQYALNISILVFRSIKT